MRRWSQVLLIGSTVVGSWLGMQLVHEFGHVLGALLTAGRVERVVLHPLTISRTDLGENPHPLLVVWAGPIVGVTIPVFAWLLMRVVRFSGVFVARFFAGFCLVANGAYIGLGSFDRIGDCGEMLARGSAIWQLWLFGVLTIPAGLLLWHGQGTFFGIGPKKRPVNLRLALGTFLTCVWLLLFGWWVDGS